MARIDVPFVVDKQHLTQPTQVVLSSGGQNYFYATFKLCDAWSDIYDKRAVFYRDDISVLMYLEEGADGLECIIPWEVMTDKGVFEVGIFGGDRLLTNLAYVKVGQGCMTEGKEPEPPTPDWFAETDRRLAELSPGGGGGTIDEEMIKSIVNEELTLAKESGEFDGEDGHTPIKGVDYWNAEDKAEMSKYIDDKTAIITEDIESLQQHINNESHFRGYVPTVEKVTGLKGTPNDFAYCAETNSQWVFTEVVEDTYGWLDTYIPVPDQLTPASDDLPLINGEASAGTAAKYARSDHRHPTDKSRASAAEVNELKNTIELALDNIIAIQETLIGGGDE